MITSRLDRLVRSFLDLDWSRWPHVLLLTAAFLASRVPFLNSGHGDDIDAWMMANSSYDLITEGTYTTSRSPGFPLPEYVDALVIKWGWIPANLITMVLSLISVIVFARVLHKLDIPHKGLLTVTYAFVPVLWINSTNTMDYMWALTFILLAWLFALRRQWAVAGLMMGLAIASRLTSVALVVPFLYLVVSEPEEHRLRDGVRFLGTAAAVSALLFLPLFGSIWWYAGHGIAYGQYDWSHDNRLVQIEDMVASTFGLVPTAFALVIGLASLKALYGRLAAADRGVVFLLLAVLVVGAMFVYHPTEGPYLIPAVPFGLALLGRVARRDLLAVFCALLVLSSYVTFNVVTTDRGHPVLRTRPGIVGQDLQNRRDEMVFARGIMDADLSHAVVIADWHLAVLRALNRKDCGGRPEGLYTRQENGGGLWDREEDILYSEVLPPDDLRAFQDGGYAVYYVAAMREWTLECQGYDLADSGAVYLEIAR